MMMSPAYALFIALALASLYLFVGVWAFAYVKPEARQALTANAFKADLLWPFHAESYEVSGQRLCGPGKILFVAVVLFFLFWAWLWAKWAMAG